MFSAKRSFKRLALPAMLAVSLLTFATGCAAPAPSSSPASSSASNSSSAEELDKEYQEWQLKYAECMRGQGQEISDPEPDGSFKMEMTEDDSAYKAADETCTKEVGDPPGQTGGSEMINDEYMLDLARCLREAGYDVPDPTDGALSLPDVSEDALKACESGS